MRKKVMAAVLTAAMVASISVVPQSVAAATDPSDLKIGLITDVGGVNDGSFNQSSWEGLEKAGEDLGVTVNYLESATDADYQPNMETFVDEDYDLIISVGYMLADATKEAAEANPDTKFAIIDDSSIDLPNVTSLMFKAEQASYLVGYVAGLTTKTNNIGFVVGMTNETMNQFGYGYCAGAIDAKTQTIDEVKCINCLRCVKKGCGAWSCDYSAITARLEAHYSAPRLLEVFL